jgi:hypothetical protein
MVFVRLLTPSWVPRDHSSTWKQGRRPKLMPKRSASESNAQVTNKAFTFGP